MCVIFVNKKLYLKHVSFIKLINYFEQKIHKNIFDFDFVISFD
jgi:hypothetical protein